MIEKATFKIDFCPILQQGKDHYQYWTVINEILVGFDGNVLDGADDFYGLYINDVHVHTFQKLMLLMLFCSLECM